MTLTQTDENRIREIVQAEVKEQLTAFRSDMVDRLDRILTVTTTTQQEVAVLAHKAAEHTDDIGNLQNRLDAVEKTAN
jgi:hypothetical protein